MPGHARFLSTIGQRALSGPIKRQLSKPSAMTTVIDLRVVQQSCGKLFVIGVVFLLVSFPYGPSADCRGSSPRLRSVHREIPFLDRHAALGEDGT
jgi:hypothetical protein